MRISRLLGCLVLGASGLLSVPGTANAANVLCQDPNNNHMLVDDAYVSACIDAGVGNIGQGNQNNDDFIKAGNTGYTTVGQFFTFTQTGLSGTFTFPAQYWADFDELFIGFKFGTGGDPDEWFVYQLQPVVSSGEWEFVFGPNFSTAGGLSHLVLYGTGDGGGDDDQIPEPASLALVGIALIAAGATRRRRKS